MPNRFDKIKKTINLEPNILKFERPFLATSYKRLYTSKIQTIHTWPHWKSMSKSSHYRKTRILIKLSFKYPREVSTPSNPLQFLSPNTPKNHMTHNHGLLVHFATEENPGGQEMDPNGLKSSLIYDQANECGFRKSHSKLTMKQHVIRRFKVHFAHKASIHQ